MIPSCKINPVIDNRYKVLKRLGRGGMGEVYKAFDLSCGKTIAVKLLFKPAGCSEAVKAFQREFVLLSEFRHPNLCEVYDFGHLKDGRFYYTMEYIDGKDIWNTVTGLADQELYPVIVQVCRALEYIHSRGLIHYDIKPGNCMISGGTAKLMDFGLAGERKIKEGFYIRGTIPYIAPEVLKGMAVDQRADLYSLGVLLYEVCTGRTIPIDRKSSFRSLLKQTMAGILEPPSKIVPDIPRGLENIILKLTAIEPSDRYNRANEVIAEINNLSTANFDLETSKTLEGYLLSGKFVGREKEFEFLQSAYQAKHPYLILINGEPGIGKSRLLKEFKVFVQLQGGCCFTGFSHPDIGFSYHAWHGIFQELVRHVDAAKEIRGSLPVLRRLFPELLEGRLMKPLPELVPLEPKQDKIRTQESLSDLVRYVAKRTGNMVIFLEDLHWADPDSLQFLEYLARGLAESNVIVCASYRTGADDTCSDLTKMRERIKTEDYFAEIDLQPFNEAALTSFLDSTITPASNSPELVQYLLTRTNGNPFFAEEMLRVLLIEKGITIGEKIGPDIIKSLVLPKRVEDLLVKRLEGLDGAAWEVLKYSSALHGNFDFGLLQRLTLLTDIDLSRVLRQLKQRQIFMDDNNCFKFYHPKLKEFIYDNLAMEEKRKLRLSIGRHLELTNKGKLNKVLPDLAFYFLSSGDYRRGLKYGLQAAAKSKERYANDEAIHLYQGVLCLLNDKDIKKRLTILETLAGIETQAGYYDNAVEHYRQALWMKNTTKVQQAAFYNRIGAAFSRKGEPKLALENYNNGLELLDNITKVKLLSKCQIYNGKCSALFQMGDYRGVEDLTYINLQLSKRLKKAERVKIQREIYNYLGSIERIRGNYEKSIRFFKKISFNSGGVNDTSDIARTFNHIGIAYYSKGDYYHAIHNYRNALKLFKKAGDWKGVSITLLNIGVVYSNQNKSQKAVESFDQALGIARKIGDNTAIAGAYHSLGVCYLDPYYYSKAEKCFHEAITYWEKVGNENDKAAGLQCLGLAHLGKGDYSFALEDLQSALTVFKKTGDPQRISKALNTMSSVYYELGMFGEARILIQESKNNAERVGLTGPLITCYSNLCAINLLDKNFNEFHECCERGQKLAHETRATDMSANFLALSADLHYSEEQYAQGILQSEKAIELLKELGDRTGSAQTVLIRAKCEAKQGILKRTKAASSFKEALKIAGETRQPELSWKAYYHYGMFLKQENDLAEALKYLKKSIEVFKEVCERITEPEHRKSYLNRPDRKEVFAAVDEMEKGNVF